jgi:hypothetical protein
MLQSGTADATRRAAVDLEALARNWDALGETDPFWAILSVEDKRGGGWEPAAFFATGEKWAAHVIACAEELKPGLARRTALDFRLWRRSHHSGSLPTFRAVLRR